ncbi:MAG: hypothetical protein IPO71_10595 [Nitrosomonas sp.]|nr:hypothetical protein [Nitrosomonas sp.]
MERAPLLFIWIILIASCLILTGCSSTPKPPVAVVSLNVQPNINPFSTSTTEKQKLQKQGRL